MSTSRFSAPSRRLGYGAVGLQLRLSVLDRLLADQASKGDGSAFSGSSPRATPEIALRGMERDLEMLLSTRQCHVEWPHYLDALPTSNWNYGTVDYAGENLAPRHIQEEFRKSIEATIRNFEPRLSRVAVTLSDVSNSPDHGLQFRIEGVMVVNSEPVTFDTTLDPVTYNVSIRTGTGT
jgi:type VI secretion system protein ImpF